MAKPILQHIRDAHGGKQAAFARACGVLPQQVTKWIKYGFLVTCDGYVISPATKSDRERKSSANV